MNPDLLTSGVWGCHPPMGSKGEALGRYFARLEVAPELSHTEDLNRARPCPREHSLYEAARAVLARSGRADGT